VINGTEWLNNIQKMASFDLVIPFHSLRRSEQMLDYYRIDGYCVNKPYRAKLNGQVLKSKKGEPLKFHSLFAAMSYAQRVSEKKSTK